MHPPKNVESDLKYFVSNLIFFPLTLLQLS